MVRFFFHITDGKSVTEDLEGEEFADIDAARAEATLAATELVSDSLKSGQGLRLHRTIRISDEVGNVIDEVLFANAVLPRS